MHSVGAISQFLASPADLVKVQMQLQGRRVLMGHKPLYTGSVHCFRELLREGGVVGMWRGWLPNVQRAALVNLGELATYDTAKQTILRNTNLEVSPLLLFVTMDSAYVQFILQSH